MKKKSLAALLMVTVLGLVACGSSASNSSMTSEVSSTTSEIQDSKVENVSQESTAESLLQPEESAGATVGETEYTGVIDNGVYVIEKCVTSEEELIVPDTLDGAPVGVIKSYAFMDVPSKTIVLPDSVTVIGDCAFWGCENLETIDLGKGLVTIAQGAFTGCRSLLTVSFPESLKTIGGAIFVACDSIGEVYIPASTTEIESIGFTDDCPNLVVVTEAGSLAEEVAKDLGLPVKNA